MYDGSCKTPLQTIEQRNWIIQAKKSAVCLKSRGDCLSEHVCFLFTHLLCTLYTVILEETGDLMGFPCFSSLKTKEWFSTYRAWFHFIPSAVTCIQYAKLHFVQKKQAHLSVWSRPSNWCLSWGKDSFSTAWHNKSLEIYELITRTRLLFSGSSEVAPETAGNIPNKGPSMCLFLLL